MDLELLKLTYEIKKKELKLLTMELENYEKQISELEQKKRAEKEEQNNRLFADCVSHEILRESILSNRWSYEMLYKLINVTSEGIVYEGTTKFHHCIPIPECFDKEIYCLKKGLIPTKKQIKRLNESCLYYTVQLIIPHGHSAFNQLKSGGLEFRAISFNDNIWKDLLKYIKFSYVKYELLSC